MENKLEKRMENLTLIILITISLCGFINTFFIATEIQNLEKKIESIKTFKSE